MNAKPRPLRVLIADDFEPVRRRLVQLLADEPDAEVVGEAASVVDTLLAIQALVPDVVILDLGMPDGNALEVLRRTRADHPRPQFIVLTSFANDEYRAEAARHQALAFLDKAREFAAAVELIRALAAGKVASCKPGGHSGGMAPHLT